jgi:hypothetical protein
LFKAGQLQAEGDHARAWNLLKGIVRASRHIEWCVIRAQDRTVGIMLAQYAREPVLVWAEDPGTSTALLRQAIEDLAAAEALTPPLSKFYRDEYRSALEMLETWWISLPKQAQRHPERSRWHVFTLAPSLETFLSGEPERSRRVLNLLVASDLTWCDRPVVDRPAFAIPRLRIPEPDSAAPRVAHALDPEVLAHYADTALITPALEWRLGEIDKWEKNDRWSLGQLSESVAVALFTKELGHPPASSAEALKRYRPIAGDSPKRDEAEPLP